MMRKVFFISTLMLFFSSVFAQESSFSIEKHGKGNQTIIFIPGFASSGMVWSETVQELKKEYTCIVLTMAGFAGVTPEKDPTFEKWKAEIALYIKSERIKKPIVIGHSMGGVLALALASDYPDLLSKIVVIDGLPCLVALNNPDFVPIKNNDCSTMIKRIESMNEEQFSQIQQASIASLTTSTQKINEILDWGLRSDRETFAKMFCDFTNIDLRERIKQITVPTLVLLEPLFKNIQDSIVNQYKGLSHAELKYANKGLHFIMYDDTEWYLENLTEFLTLE